MTYLKNTIPTTESTPIHTQANSDHRNKFIFRYKTAAENIVQLTISKRLKTNSKKQQKIRKMKTYRIQDFRIFKKTFTNPYVHYAHNHFFKRTGCTKYRAIPVRLKRRKITMILQEIHQQFVGISFANFMSCTTSN